MAISSTKFKGAAQFRIHHDSAVTVATISQNVSEGTGRLFSIQVDNSKDASNAVYVKVYDVVSPSLGASYPCHVIKVAAASIETIQIPYGLEYDSLSVSLTNDANPISQNNPSSSTSVTLVSS